MENRHDNQNNTDTEVSGRLTAKVLEILKWIDSDFVPGDDLIIRPQEWRQYRDTRYQVSNFGRIRSIPKDGNVLKAKILKPVKPNGSHLAVGIYHNGKKTMTYIHRMVMETFGPPPSKDKPYVTHYDDDPTNNHISNLCWGNAQTNAWDRKFNDPRTPVTKGTDFLSRKKVDELLQEISDRTGEYPEVIFDLIINGLFVVIEPDN